MFMPNVICLQDFDCNTCVMHTLVKMVLHEVLVLWNFIAGVDE